MPGYRQATTTGGGSALAYFTLVLVLSVPFWTAGALVRGEILPGLPVSSLMVAAPALSAIILSLARAGPGGAARCLARAVDASRIRPRLAVVALLLVNPGLFATCYVVQRATGVAVPAPEIALASLPVLLAMFLVAGVLEELGWTGTALEPLRARVGAVGASIVIGIAWAAWHVVPLAQVGRSFTWIAWWSLWTVALRVLMVWLHARTGRSVFGMALFHAMINVCWQLYPVNGTYFDPAIAGLVTAGVAFAALLVDRRN